MKTYVITTGTIFGLIVVVHIWRVAAEGLALAKDPVFVMLTVAAGALSIWSIHVLRTITK